MEQITSTYEISSDICSESSKTRCNRTIVELLWNNFRRRFCERSYIDTIPLNTFSVVHHSIVIVIVIGSDKKCKIRLARHSWQCIANCMFDLHIPLFANSTITRMHRVFELPLQISTKQQISNKQQISLEISYVLDSYFDCHRDDKMSHFGIA